MTRDMRPLRPIKNNVWKLKKLLQRSKEHQNEANNKIVRVHLP